MLEENKTKNKQGQSMKVLPFVIKIVKKNIRSLLFTNGLLLI